MSFFDTIKGLSALLSYVKNANLDENIQDQIDEYRLKYLCEGWSVITSVMRVIVVLILLFSFLFVNLEDPFFLSSCIASPT